MSISILASINYWKWRNASTYLPSSCFYDDGPLGGIEESVLPWLALLDAFSLLLFCTTWRRALLTSLFWTLGAGSQDPPSAEAREADRLVSRNISSTACLECKRNVFIRKYTSLFKRFFYKRIGSNSANFTKLLRNLEIFWSVRNGHPY